MNLKGDFMRVNMDEKIIYAHGKRDTIDGKPTVTNPTFTEGAANPYTMDTITYNIGSKKAKIKGVATQEGDGWLIGNNVKRWTTTPSTSRTANTPPATRRTTPTSTWR